VLLVNARNKLWEQLKEVCNKNAEIEGVEYWNYILKAKDYVPLKDLKEWIRKEEIKKIKQQQEQNKDNEKRGIHDSNRWN